MKLMKGFIQIPLLIIVIASVLISSAGISLYFHNQEKSLATETESTLEMTESLECPSCECPECECPVCLEGKCPICEPEIIVKEVIKEIPVQVIKEVEVIKEVPVEKIVYQDRIIYQEISSPCDCSSIPPTEEQSLEQPPISLTIQSISASENKFSFTNPSSNNIKVNFLDFVLPLKEGAISISIKFPNSMDSSCEYTLATGAIENYTVKAVPKFCEPNYDGILPEGCSRQKVSSTLINTIRPGELAQIRVSLGVYSGDMIPSGNIKLNYTTGSITDTVTTTDILFSTIEF